VPSTLITARASILPNAPRPLKDRTHLRLHVGTAETMANVRLVSGEAIRQGETGYVQLFLSEPVVVTWNQPLVLRSESPVTTVGGGRVLDPNAQRLRHADDAVLKLLGELSSSDELTRAAAAVYFAGLRGFNAADLARTAGIAEVADVEQALRQRGALVELPVSHSKKIVAHPLALEHTYAHIGSLLAKLHEQNPLVSSHPRAPLATRLDWLGEPAMIDAILQRMEVAGLVKLTEARVSLVGHGPKLSKNEQALLEQLVARYLAAGFQPPSVKEVQQETSKNREAVPQLVALAAAEGQLVEFAQGFYLHADHERRAREIIRDELARSPQGLTVSQIRELLGTSRKYAVPLCEYFDRAGFTKRAGDVRTLAVP
jgi:selenocysteine-specific elongation factor